MKLKPCPFCGGKAEYIFKTGYYEKIYCDNCHINTDKQLMGEAEKIWNRRVRK